MEIEINLWGDYIASLRIQLINSGFDLSGAETDDEIFIGFFNLKKRKVSATPRKIHLSQEFHCPAEFLQSIANIKKAIEGGQDITPYLSKKVGDLGYSDLMLNDWGIHHMHLGETLDQSGFIHRTGPLLFVRFTETEAYFVNIFDHGAWSKQEIVASIHKNWPSLIAAFRDDEALGLRYRFTDNDIATLRKSNVNAMLELDDGTIYTSIGMGSALNGTSTEVLSQLRETRKELRQVQKAVFEEATANMSRFSGLQKLKFLLEISETAAQVVEVQSRVAYKIY